MSGRIIKMPTGLLQTEFKLMARGYVIPDHQKDRMILVSRVELLESGIDISHLEEDCYISYEEHPTPRGGTKMKNVRIIMSETEFKAKVEAEAKANAEAKAKADAELEIARSQARAEAAAREKKENAGIIEEALKVAGEILEVLAPGVYQHQIVEAISISEEQLARDILSVTLNLAEKRLDEAQAHDDEAKLKQANDLYYRAEINFTLFLNKIERKLSKRKKR